MVATGHHPAAVGDAMDITSVEGLLVALLFVFPGALGDIAMRESLDMLQPKTAFRQLTSAVAWSLTALLALESLAAFGAGSFGQFLIDPVLSIGPSGEGVDVVASRWIVFAVVAALLPALTRRYLVQPLINRLEDSFEIQFRTLQRSSIDVALEKAHLQTPGGALPSRVTTPEGTVEGFVVWSTVGREEDAALILQKTEDDKSLVWVPARSIVALELFDKQERLHPRD